MGRYRPGRVATAVAALALVAAALVAVSPAGAASPVRVSVGDQSGLERDTTTGSVFVPIVLSAPAASDVVVSFATRDVTAVAGADYTAWGTPAAPRTVTIPAGQRQTQVNVPVLTDEEVEADETFELELLAATGADVVMGRTVGVATIVDADGVSAANPAITVSDTSVVEGDAGQVRAQFLIHQSRPTATPVTVTYATADGSGTAGSDYVAKLPGSVVFAPGQVSKTIDVLVNSDSAVNGSRTFTLAVTVAGGSPVEEIDTVGTATVLDDDVVADTDPPVLTLPGALSVAAQNASGATVTWTASALDAVDGAVALTCTPPSGSTFPIGTASVSCQATDAAGNSATGSFEVTVQPLPPVRAVDVVSGWNHACALMSDGTVRCWGGGSLGSSGSLGDGTKLNSNTPQRVLGVEGATAITASLFHSCAIVQGGAVRCWGSNGSGQLGDGTTTSSLTAVTVAGLSGAVEISAGSSHTCAVLGDGTVRCWGNNGNGQLGDGTTTSSLSPVAVAGLSGVTRIAAGTSHTCAVRADGTARCWGAGGNGRLGNGSTTSSSSPVVVSGLTAAVDIAAGSAHTCATRTDGTARCWGAGGSGRLGNGATSDKLTPVAVSFLAGVVAIAAGDLHTCAVRSDGTGRCWGSGLSGRLGNGSTTSSSSPVVVSGLTAATSIAAGSDHSCAGRSDGSVACWGLGSYGQLGNGSTTNSNLPVTVLGLPETATPPPSGVVGTLAGDSDGYVDATGTAARFGSLGGADVGPDGSLYVVDTGNFAVRRVTPDGTVSTYVGTGSRGSTNGPRQSAQLYSPTDVAVAPDGTVYVAEAVDEFSAGVYDLSVINRIRRITPSGDVTTFVGGSPAGYADGVGLAAKFYLPTSIDVGPDGALYVADYGNQRIRRVTPDGVVSTLTSNLGSVFSGVTQLAVDSDGDVVFTDPSSRLRRLSNGVVTDLAGTTSAGTMDGLGVQARFGSISGMAFAPDGALLVSDNGDRKRLRRVDAAGQVTTIAGGTTGSADGVGSAAQFGSLTDVAVSSSGVVYLNDSVNRRIRTVQ